MKSSLHSLIPFLPLFCQLPTPELNSILCCNGQLQNSTQFSATTANSGTQLSAAWDPRYIASGRLPHTENTPSSIVACWFTAAEMCLPHGCVTTSAGLTTENTALLLLRAFASAGICLPSRCLAMNYSGFQASCRNIFSKCVLCCF
jgi:hypothetical protein